MDDNCLFCKIVAKKIPSKMVLEEPNLIAIQDINPQGPVHLLVIPKEHIPTVDDIKEEHVLLVGQLVEAAKRLARGKGISKSYRLVFNNGREAGQSVFHLHLHLIGGRPMSWPPG
jgi:histidine triad (HIT) family protein